MCSRGSLPEYKRGTSVAITRANWAFACFGVPPGRRSGMGASESAATGASGAESAVGGAAGVVRYEYATEEVSAVDAVRVAWTIDATTGAVVGTAADGNGRPLVDRAFPGSVAEPHLSASAALLSSWPPDGSPICREHQFGALEDRRTLRFVCEGRPVVRCFRGAAGAPPVAAFEQWCADAGLPAA